MNDKYVVFRSRSNGLEILVKGDESDVYTLYASFFGKITDDDDKIIRTAYLLNEEYENTRREEFDSRW